MPRRWNVDSSSGDSRLATVEARLDTLAIAVREQARHLTELHRCVARLQVQVAALERVGLERAPVDFNLHRGRVCDFKGGGGR